MSGIIKHWSAFLENPWRARYAVILLLVNAAGSIYGYFWYHEQLKLTDRYFWLFVPDSPLATTLLVLVLGLSLLGIRNIILDLIAFTANIKYGLWAVFMISDFWIRGGNIDVPELMLWFSHLGMAVQGAIYLKSCSVNFNGNMIIPLITMTAWMLLNDFIDYYFDVYPYLYYAGQEKLGALVAVGFSLIFGAIGIGLIKKDVF